MDELADLIRTTVRRDGTYTVAQKRFIKKLYQNLPIKLVVVGFECNTST